MARLLMFDSSKFGTNLFGRFWILTSDCRAAKKYSCKGIKNAHELLHREMYISSVDFVFFPNSDTGRMNVIWCVWSPHARISLRTPYFSHDYVANIHLKNHGKSFKTFSEWSGVKYLPIIQHIVGYANYVDQQRKEESEPEMDDMEPINFDSGPGMLPLLPEAVHGVRGIEVGKDAQEIIRAYFLCHYRKPWAYRPSLHSLMMCFPRTCDRHGDIQDALGPGG
jgi:hypothetical protein